MRLDPALVHRRARPAEVVRHLPGRARERLRGGHAASTARPSTASAASRRATCSPGPTPTRFELLPWGRRRRDRRPACSATSPTSTARRSRATPARSSSATSTGPASAGFSSTSPPRWSSSTSRRDDAVAAARAARHRRLLRPHHRRRRLRPPQAHHPHARGHGHPGRVLVPRGQPQPARDRPALHRRPHHGRQRDDVPPGRARDRPWSTACYATFMPKPLAGVQGSGMHTHLSLFEGDSNAFHDPATTTGLSKVGRAFIAGLLHHAPEITAVTNQLVNSYKRLIAGSEAPVHVTLGPQQPLGPGPGAGHQAGQGVLGPHRVPLARPGLQPVPRLLGASSPPGSRASRRATSCPTRPPPTSSS